MKYLLLYFAPLVLTNAFYFLFRAKKDKTDYSLFMQLTLVPLLNLLILGLQLRILWEDYVKIKTREDE